MESIEGAKQAEDWTNEVDTLRQDVGNKKILFEETERQIMNFELENDEMEETIKPVNAKLSALTQACYKGATYLAVFSRTSL